MSASERLIAAREAVEEFTQLAEHGDDLLDELLDAYAHELAEKIRPSGPDPNCCMNCSAVWQRSMENADLIDPEHDGS